MIDIYDIDDRMIMQAEITSSAVREQELSKTDKITLSWSSAEKVVLPAGAYIKHTYKIDKVREVTRNFLLLDAYEPTQSDECTWKYTPEFQHPKMVLSKVPFFIYTKNSQNEDIKQSVWEFTGDIKSLATKLCSFLNKDIKFGNAAWKCVVSDTETNNITVSFSDIDFLSALTSITNALGDNAEWHIDYDDEIIYLGKVVIGGDSVTLSVGENVGVPSITSSKEDYFNTFRVFGGTRNITQVNSKGENISSGDIRLQLESGVGTTDVDGVTRQYTIDEYSTIDMRRDPKEPQFTKVLEFSDIFPSLDTYVYDVRGRKKYILDSTTNEKIPVSYNPDGTVREYKTFTVWYMRLAYPTTEKIDGKELVNTTSDNGVTHYWYDFDVTDDMLVNGKNLSCSFEPNFAAGAMSTPLCGRGSNGDYVGFELTYHKEGKSSKTSDDVDGEFNVKAGDYEIVYQEDGNWIVPTNEKEGIIPHGENKPSFVCNKTVLYNITMNEDVYMSDARKRLFDAAMKEINRLLADLNNYSLKSYPQVFAQDDPCLQIGQNVVYNDGHGYTLDTRVLKLTYNIDYDCIQTITVGNQSIKGSLTQLKDDVQSIMASGSGTGGGYTVSELNSLIAKYGIRYFLSKNYPDTASGLITFLQGMALGSGQWNFDKDGVGQLYQMLLSGEHNGVQASNLLSSNFSQADKTGFWVTDDDGAKYSYMEIDKLYVRYKAVFDELEIRKRTYVGGNAMFSNAASKIVGVEWLDKEGNTTTDITKIHTFKCHLKTDDGTTQTQNLWRVNDLALCQTFNIKENKDSGVQNKAYWRLVTAVGDDYICLSNVKEEYDGFGVDHSADAANYGTSAKVVLAGADGVVSDGDVLTDGADGMNVPADFPEAEDAIVQCGNTQDVTRQNMIELLTYTPSTTSVLYGGGAAPALIQYAGINGFTLQGKAKTVISPSGNVFRAKSFIIELGDGTSTHVPLDMGEWTSGKEYPYYARVSHKGELWLLDGITEGLSTTDEPGTTSAWTRQVAKGKDGDGLNVKGTIVEHFKDFADFKANVKEDHTKEETPYFLLVSGRVVGVNSAIIVDSAADYSEDHDGDVQQGTARPSILTYTNDPIYDWDVAEAKEADGYMDADGVLWVAGKTQWTEAGTIKGEKGDKGDDAEWYEVEAYVSGGGIISSVSTDKDGKPKLSSFAVRLVRHVGNRGTAVPSKWSVPSQKEYGVTSVAGGVFALVQYGTLTIGEMTITATYNGKEYTKSIPVVKDGQTGDKGDDGEDAIDVLISPETLMFDTDDDGNLLTNTQTAHVTLRKGGTLLHPEEDYTIDQCQGVNVNKKGISVVNEEQGYAVTIDPTQISTYEIVDEQGNKTTYPYTDGYVAMVINVGGSLNLTKRVMFRVNYAKYVGRVSWTQKQFESKFEKTTTDMNGSITQMKSDIKQNADSISLVVTEDGAKQSGMLISKDGTTLMGKKIKLDNGGESVPLVLEDGKLNADLIEVTHLYAKDSRGNVIGYLGDPTGEHTKVTEGSKIIHYAPLYVGGKDAAHSAFRVYSDGITHLEKAQIVGGKVGGFTATDSSLVIGGDTLVVDDKGNPILDKNGNKQYEQHNRMSLTSGAITFNSKDRTIMASFGNASAGETSGWEQFPLNISKKRDYTEYEQGRRNIGIMIDVEGEMKAKSTDDWGNHALYIMHGDIYGFRLRHRVMDSSNDTMQLMNGDCNITIYGWNNTLIMPKFPEDGMTVFVRNHSTKNSTLMQCSYTDDEKKTHPDAVAATLEWVKDIGANQYQMQTGLTSLTVLPGRYMILTYCGVKNIWMGGQFMN